jgi:uncharacterized membrane protein
MRSFKKISGSNPTPKDFRENNGYVTFSAFNSFTVAEFFWLLFGLATKSWAIFFVLVMFHLIFRFIMNSQFVYVGKHFGFLFQILKSICILFLVINHFHLHINLLDLL